MKNEFDYKPNISYTKQEINTIDNLRPFLNENSDLSIQIIANPAIKLKNISANIEKIDKLLSEIESHHNNYYIIVDDITNSEYMKNYIKTKIDGDKYVNEKKITFSLYKEAIDDPYLYSVMEQFNEHEAETEGHMDLELYPILNTLKEDNLALEHIVEDVVMKINDCNNLDDVISSIANDIINLDNAKKDIQNSYDDLNITSDDIHKKEKYRDFAQLKYDANMDLMKSLNILSNDSGSTINKIDNALDSYYNRDRSYNNEISTIKNTTKNPSLKYILYKSFNSSNKKITQIRKDNEYQDLRAYKDESVKQIVQNILLFVQYIISFLNELDYMQNKESIQTIFNTVIKGIKEILAEKNNALLNLRNVFSGSNYKNNQLINEIIEKDKSRQLYNNI